MLLARKNVEPLLYCTPQEGDSNVIKGTINNKDIRRGLPSWTNCLKGNLSKQLADWLPSSPAAPAPPIAFLLSRQANKRDILYVCRVFIHEPPV